MQFHITYSLNHYQQMSTHIILTICLFQSVVNNLDESKIAWADQQGGKNVGEQQQGGGNNVALGGELSSCTTTDCDSVVPRLDVKYFTSLPITPSVTISPVVTQGQPKTFRLVRLFAVNSDISTSFLLIIM